MGSTFEVRLISPMFLASVFDKLLSIVIFDKEVAREPSTGVPSELKGFTESACMT